MKRMVAFLLPLLALLALVFAPGGAIVTAQSTAIPPVTSNKQWTPQLQAVSGVDMALVPPGCFAMGSDKGADDEKPVTKICFNAVFWIDKIEVTQAQFKLFKGKQDSPSFFPGKNRPVEQISWAEASAYCALRQARLPTEAEWEYAARGPDNLVYPWGDTFDETAIVWKQGNSDGTGDAGSKAAGVSWVGTLDMSGNVYEWVSTLYKPYPYDAKDGRESDSNSSDPRVLRGGSWDLNDPMLERASRRYWDDPSYRINNIGFRCARTDVPKPSQAS